MERSQYTFYLSFESAALKIRKVADRCKFYDVITAYALHSTIPDFDSLPDTVALAFDLVKPTLDASRRKSENGKAGGKSKREANGKQTASKAEANRKQTESKAEANRKQSGSYSEGEKKNEVENEVEVENEDEVEVEKEEENECYISPFDDPSIPPSFLPDGRDAKEKVDWAAKAAEARERVHRAFTGGTA